MNRKNRRTPRNYDGTEPTSQKLKDLLPQILQKAGGSLNVHAEKIIESWPGIIGDRFAPMARAKTFIDGILTVSVTNSTLLSLLQKNEKTILLDKLRKKFPGVQIKTILFKIG